MRILPMIECQCAERTAVIVSYSYRGYYKESCGISTWNRSIVVVSHPLDDVASAPDRQAKISGDCGARLFHFVPFDDQLIAFILRPQQFMEGMYNDSRIYPDQHDFSTGIGIKHLVNGGG